jgi:hypothetical protein
VESLLLTAQQQQLRHLRRLQQVCAAALGALCPIPWVAKRKL